MNTIVNVRMDGEMLSKTEKVAKEQGYLSVQEYMREAVRKDIEQYNRLKAELDAIIDSAKKVKPRYLTREERDALAKKPLTAKEQAKMRKWEKLAKSKRA